MTDVKVPSNQSIITPLDNSVFLLTQGDLSFLIIKREEEKKTASSVKTPFEDIKIICLDCLDKNHPTTITHEYKPVIEVSPHIEVNSSDSMKKRALILLAGAIMGVVITKYGLGVTATIGSMIVNQLNLNILKKVQKIVRYLQDLNLFEKTKEIKLLSTAHKSEHIPSARNPRRPRLDRRVIPSGSAFKMLS